MICSDVECTGCGACANICPKKCIDMHEDKYSFIHPQIDYEKCVSCHRCEHICPSNHMVLKHKPIWVYAAHRLDVHRRLDSSSGGIAAVFAEKWLEESGFVFGTEYDGSFRPIIKLENTIEGIEKFKGSKYIQSDTGRTYTDVFNLLRAGKKIMYFGTPCQLAGLYSFLGERPDNLLTVEILCHGVSSYDYFIENLQMILLTQHIKNIDGVSFRSNRWMQDFYLTLWKNGKIAYDSQAYEDYYFSSFLTGLSLRESCYSCKYKSIDRIGDLVVGDFIGLGKKIHFRGNPIRESFVACTTEKSAELIDRCAHLAVFEPRTIEEALDEGRSLKEPFPRHPKQSQFRELVSKEGFINAVKKTTGDEIKQRIHQNKKLRIKRHIKLFLLYTFHVRIENRRIQFEK